ncbi:hypothetical protein EW145_g4549 [Phellinidium pouzarii]|uniref:DUF952 domain-containing protein n=1 Tax=Phellinidium pouzarii TaxID=167371 RepID=A0A4S4L4Y6_9AGAM|nr:hypothetical protein EW145_g4549 [Phellinidium pouzarii]
MSKESSFQSFTSRLKLLQLLSFGHSLVPKMTAPKTLLNYVYKILPNSPVYQGVPIPIPSSWDFPQTEVDLNDGFAHLSTREQLLGTLSRFFNEDISVQLLKVDYPRMSASKIVKWEIASNGAAFPHLYARLTGEFVKDLKIVNQEDSWKGTVKKLEEQSWLED